MQNALLGFAIAVIVALVAALTAPHFMDWSRYRALFETELSRVIGENVRITGALDARLLPTPSLRLHGLSFGKEGAAFAAQAESLDVEFSLGDLMRGAWRANELSIRGATLKLRLDQDGRMPPGIGQKFDLSGLAVDKLNFSGAIILEEANGEALLSLSALAFAGEWRAMSGSLRGEGHANVAGRRLAYRLSSSLAGDSSALKLRLGVNADAVNMQGASAPREPLPRMEFLQGPLAGDFDGAITLEGGVPEVAGNLTISRPVLLRTAKGAGAHLLDAPWRIGGKAKLRFDALTFESLDLLYGADDGGLKMSGVARAEFGKVPRVQAVLSARQIDADRLLADGAGQARAPFAVISEQALIAAQSQPLPFALELQASVENVVLGGRASRAIGLDLRADQTGWQIQKLELQAPGGTNVALSGRVASVSKTQMEHSGFVGSVALDSVDVASFLAWLGAQGAPAPSRLAKLALRGDLRIAPGNFAMDRMEGTLDGSAFTGAFAVAPMVGDGPGRQKASVTLAADEVDVERIVALVSGAGLTRDMWPRDSQPRNVWPYETAFDLRAARALWLGQIARDVEIKARLSPARLTLERLALTNPGGLSLDGSGEVDLAASAGQVQVRARADSMASIAGLVAPLSPLVSRRLMAAAGEDRDVEARLTFDVARDARAQKVADAKIGMDVTAASLRGHAKLSAHLPDGDVMRLLPGAWSDLALTLQADVEMPRDQVALSLVGLDGIVASSGAPAKMTLSLQRAAQKPFGVKAALNAPSLDAALSGTLAAFVPSEAKSQTDLRLDVSRATIAPLIAGAGNAEARLSSRIAMMSDGVRLEGIDAMIAGSRLRGAVSIKTQTAHGDLDLDGDLGVDRFEAGPVLFALIGARHASAPNERWSKEPFVRSALRDWRGRIAFEALAGTLAPGLESRPLRGIILNDGRTLKLAELGGHVGGGAWRGEMNLRQQDGIAFDGQFKFDNVASDAVPLMRDAIAGRLGGAINMTSQGRSPAALIGSTNGSGTITLSGAKLAKLNADAFAQALARMDRETDVANSKASAEQIGDVVRTAMDAAPLSVAQAEVPLMLRAGRLVVESATLRGEGARLVIDGTYDLISSAADLRLKFEATNVPALAGVGAPAMSIMLRKTGETLTREVDPSALIAWLIVRGVDRETHRLEALEKSGDKSGDKSGEKPGEAAPPAIIADEPSRKPASNLLEQQRVAPQNREPENLTPDNPAPENALPDKNVPLPQPKPAARPAPPRVKPKPTPQGGASALQPLPPQLPPPIDVRPPPGLR